MWALFDPTAVKSLHLAGSVLISDYLAWDLILLQMPNLRDLRLTVELDELPWGDDNFNLDDDPILDALLESAGDVYDQLDSLHLRINRDDDGVRISMGVVGLFANLRSLVVFNVHPFLALSVHRRPGNIAYAYARGEEPLDFPRLQTLYFDLVAQDFGHRFKEACRAVGKLVDRVDADDSEGPPPASGDAWSSTAMPSLKVLGFCSLDFAHPDPALVSTEVLVTAARTLKAKGVDLVDRYGRTVEGV